MHVKYGRTTIRTLCSSEKSSWQTVEEPLKSHTPQTCSCQKHKNVMIGQDDYNQRRNVFLRSLDFELIMNLCLNCFWWFLRRNSSPDVSLTPLFREIVSPGYGLPSRWVSVVYVVDRSFIGLGLRPLFIIRWRNINCRGRSTCLCEIYIANTHRRIKFL